MYNNCKNIAQQTIRFLASVLENINLNINIFIFEFPTTLSAYIKLWNKARPILFL